jgi:hypothetical protein
MLSKFVDRSIDRKLSNQHFTWGIVKLESKNCLTIQAITTPANYSILQLESYQFTSDYESPFNGIVSNKNNKKIGLIKIILPSKSNQIKLKCYNIDKQPVGLDKLIGKWVNAKFNVRTYTLKYADSDIVNGYTFVASVFRECYPSDSIPLERSIS